MSMNSGMDKYKLQWNATWQLKDQMFAICNKYEYTDRLKTL